MDWKVRTQEKKVLGFVSWGNQLDYVFLLGRLDTSGVDDEFLSLDAATEPELKR